MTKYLGKYISATTGHVNEIHFATAGNPAEYIKANYPVFFLVSVFPWSN